MSQYAMMKLLENYYTNTKVLGDISIYNKREIHNGFELNEIFGSNIKMEYFEGLVNKVRFAHHKTYSQDYASGYPEDATLFQLLVDRYNYRVQGTFHNYNYETIREMLIHDFTFPELSDEVNRHYLEQIRRTNSCSVHLRRGDYVKLGLDICGSEYYSRAMEIVEQKVNDVIYYVFSDDAKEARLMFGEKENVVYVTSNRDKKSYIDMQLMSNCKHNIIANSTFSYWAAWLNCNRDKVVIRPKMQTATRETWKVKDWILL